MHEAKIARVAGTLRHREYVPLGDVHNCQMFSQSVTASDLDGCVCQLLSDENIDSCKLYMYMCALVNRCFSVFLLWNRGWVGGLGKPGSSKTDFYYSLGKLLLRFVKPSGNSRRPLMVHKISGSYGWLWKLQMAVASVPGSHKNFFTTPCLGPVKAHFK